MEHHLSGLTHSRHILINSARKIIGLDWVDLIEDLNNLAEQCLDSSFSCRVQLLCALHVNCTLSVCGGGITPRRVHRMPMLS